VTSSRREAIERLVRQDLGCTCPAEIFEQVEEGQAALPGLPEPVQRIAIGGRLLVYLVEADDASRALARLPAWLAAGRTERDATGMNRLRLVLVADDTEPLVQALPAAFEALPDCDDRTHLHVLPRSALAGL
jgi:hypothetical protein